MKVDAMLILPIKDNPKSVDKVFIKSPLVCLNKMYKKLKVFDAVTSQKLFSFSLQGHLANGRILVMQVCVVIFTYNSNFQVVVQILKRIV